MTKDGTKLKRFYIEEVGERGRVDPALGPDAYSDTWFAIYVRDRDGLAVHVADRKSLESAESLLALIFELSKKATTGWLEELKSEVKEVQEALKRAEAGDFPSAVTLDTGGGIMREFTIDPSDTSRKAEYVRKKVLSSYRDQLRNINIAMKDVEANLRTWKPQPLPGDA